jgi:hypothetical protein
MQKLTVAQDNEIGLTFRLGGAAWTFHEVPSHSCALPGPTASQKFVDTHDTASRPSNVGPDGLSGLGVAWIFHEVPFHVSARFRVLPALSECEPTASQKVAVTQDTALSELAVAPGGATAFWISQCPFHLSARGRGAETCDVLLSPPASQTPAEQDTALRSVTPAVAGLGGSCALHALPFHSAASLWTSLVLVLKNSPTASQNDDELHDTADAVLSTGMV